MSSYLAPTNCARASSATATGSASSTIVMPCRSNSCRCASEIFIGALLYTAEQRRPRRARSLVPVEAPRARGGAGAERGAGIRFAQQAQQLRRELVDVRGLEVPDRVAAEFR